MTSYPKHNYPAFFDAAVQLRAAGFDVENPADNDGATAEEAVRNVDSRPLGAWSDYMRRDIPRLLRCDGVATLPNWGVSRGAALEVHVGDALGMHIQGIEAWLREAEQRRAIQVSAW